LLLEALENSCLAELSAIPLASVKEERQRCAKEPSTLGANEVLRVARGYFSCGRTGESGGAGKTLFSKQKAKE